MPKPGFTVEQIRSFLAVAEHEHVSRAAASLHLTQGAVTQQVHNFERALGLRLLERDGRGIRLTDAGREMATTCRAALRGIEVVEDTGRALRMLEAGSLHIGASPTCASHYLPSRLARFIHQFPKVSLNVTIETSAEVSDQVRAGALDCALVEGPATQGLLRVVLAYDELVLVVHSAHPLAQLDSVGSTDLAKHRYIGRGPAWAAEKNVQEALGVAYGQSEVMNLGHPEYVRAAALAGLGYAGLPLLAVRADIEAGVLKRIPGLSSTRPISAIRREAKGGPTLEEFWRFLVGDLPTAASPG